MAENISQKQLELEKKRLVELQKQLKAIEQLNDAQKEDLKNVEKLIKATDKRIAQAKKKAEYQKLENKEFESFAKKFRQMSQDVQAQLKGTSSSAAVYLSIGKNIAKEKAIQAKYADKEGARAQQLLANAQERESVFTDIATDAAAQAKATQKAEDDLRGISDVERQIKDIKESTGLYNAVQKKQLIAQLQQTEVLRQKEERLKYLKEQQAELTEMMPEGLQKSIGFAKGLGNAIKAGMGPLFLIGTVIAAAIKSFMDLEESAGKFREETGLTNSQMEGVRSQAIQISQEFSGIGVKAEDVFNTVGALKSEFSDITDFSEEVVASLTVLNKNFGVSNENAAKVQATFERMGGLSSETAANLQMQVADMANLAGVAPAKVMADIAESAEDSYKFFRGDVKAMAQTAVEARRLGTSLKDVLSTTEKLLDFESGIEDELVAATFVGGQFNLSRARGLAYAGKELEAQEEILNQIQRSGDFRDQDLFTQKALAKAANMEAGEIIKQLDQRDKLATLTTEQREQAEAALKAGLDITNINEEQLAQEVDKFAKQQEMQTQLEKINNSFMGMAQTIGMVLIPVIDAISIALTPISLLVQGIQWVFGGIGEAISAMVGPLGTVGKIIKGLVGMAIIFAAYKAYASYASIPVVGAIKGGLAAAAIIASGFSLLSKVGDLSSPADGKTRVSTKEGGLFELSPNDDLVAAPGAAAALAGGVVEGGGSGLNLSALSAPMQVMVNEIKALRADMASGKIAVYMDSTKVSSELGKKVDQQTRNINNIATA